MDRVKRIKKMQKMRRFKSNTFRLVAFMLVFTVVMCVFDDALAKYFFKDVSDETIVANTFYFSSDYLDERDDAGNPPIYTMNGWDGKTTKNYAFVIRNYENPLLFNDSSQDVDYKITYKTDYSDDVKVTLWKYEPESPDAVNDYVLIPTGQIETIEGGVAAYNRNDYKIVVESKNPDVAIEKDIEFEVDATTVNTKYIKQISAKVKILYTKYTSYITSKGFKDVTKESHALTYNICTANQQEQTDMTNTDTLIATKTFCLHWNNEYLQINRFDNRLVDNNYVFIGNTNDENSNTYTKAYIEEHLDEFKNKVIIDNLDGKNTGYLYYDTLPFSEFNIRFFKRTGIEDEIWDDVSDMADVYIIDEV